VAVRPTVVLADLLAAVESLQQRLATYDPLAVIRAAIDELKELITEVIDDFRPTVLLGGVLRAYDEILSAAGGLDVQNLLEPILTELRSITDQLDHGLEGTGGAFTRMQGVLERIR
jgi:hypothetical protein